MISSIQMHPVAASEWHHPSGRSRATGGHVAAGARRDELAVTERVLSKNPIDAVRRADSTLDARRVATFVTAESLC